MMMTVSFLTEKYNKTTMKSVQTRSDIKNGGESSEPSSSSLVLNNEMESRESPIEKSRQEKTLIVLIILNIITLIALVITLIVMLFKTAC